MRVAVVFFGLARKPSLTIGSIRRNVFEANAGQGIAFTTVASLNLVKELNNRRSHEVGVAVPEEEVFLLGADTYLLRRQNDADIAPWLALVQAQADPYADNWASLTNLLHQLASLRRAWALIEAAEPAFDRVLFLRPDLLYNEPLPLAAMSHAFDAPGCIALPAWSPHGGFNDRFAFADLTAARRYAMRLDMIADFCAEQPLSSEALLAYALARGDCRVMDLPVTAHRVRTYGAVKPEPFARRAALTATPQPLLLKPGTTRVTLPRGGPAIRSARQAPPQIGRAHV